MTAPDDQDLVLSALRLGWYVSVVRGWNRPGGPTAHLQLVPKRLDNELPLRSEREATEQRVEAQAILLALADKLGVDSDDSGASYGKHIDELARALSDARKAASRDAAAVLGAWKSLGVAVFKFDAHVQDVLAGRSDTQAAGYELGHGLADIYWGLDIEPPPQDDNYPSWTSWQFLLGSQRCRELTRLLGSLSNYLSNYTASTVAGSLGIWETVALDLNWRRALDASICLYEQVQRWYELLVLGQDPSTLTKPYAVIRNWNAVRKLLRAFLLQFALGVATLAILIWFLLVLSNPGHNTVIKTVLGALSIIGITTTSVLTRLKNQAQSVIKRIWQDAYTDLLVLSITVVPSQHRLKTPGPLTRIWGHFAMRGTTEMALGLVATPIETSRRDKAMLLRTIQRRSLTPPSQPPV